MLLSAAERQKDDGDENKPAKRRGGGGKKKETDRKIGDLLLIYGQTQLTVLAPVHKHESRNALNK